MRLHTLKASSLGGQAFPHFPIFLNRQPTTSKNTAKKKNCPRKTDPIANLLSKLTLIRGELHSRCQSVVPPQNGGHISCFQPKTDKQVSHSNSDELTPGSSVSWVINVAYLLGTELCVFFAPPPQKKMSTFQNENIHFSHRVSALHQHSFSFSQRKERLVTKGGYVTEKHLRCWHHICTHSCGDLRCAEGKTAELSWQPSCFAENNCSVEDFMS